MKTNIKMKVIPEQSRRVQEIAFANGCGWSYDLEKTIKYENKPYIFIEGERLYYANKESVFKKNENEEVDADLFIRTNGTCEETKIEEDKMEWIPYNGQELEVGKEYLVTTLNKQISVWSFDNEEEDLVWWKTISAYMELPKPYEKPKTLKERLDEAVEKYCYEFSKEEWENSEMRKICIHYSHISKKFEIETRYAREIFSPYYFLDLFKAQAFINSFTTDELMQIMKGEIR